MNPQHQNASSERKASAATFAPQLEIKRDAKAAPTVGERAQALILGFIERRRVARQYQAQTPYPSAAAFNLATHNFSRSAQRQPPAQRAMEWRVYQSTANIQATGQPAFLHSFQRPLRLQSELEHRGVTEGPLRFTGNIYNPGLSADDLRHGVPLALEFMRRAPGHHGHGHGDAHPGHPPSQASEVPPPPRHGHHGHPAHPAADTSLLRQRVQVETKTPAPDLPPQAETKRPALHPQPTVETKTPHHQHHEQKGPQHDMRSNSAWMLGLAHHGVSAVMTTALDDETLVRQSARKRNLRPQEAFSALGREVLGMVQHGAFAPVAGPRGTQILAPTADAKHATLASMQTPRGLPRAEIKRRLNAKGIDVKRIT